MPIPADCSKLDEQTKGTVDYRWGDRWAFAYPNFLDCKREIRSLAIAAFRYGGGTVSGSGDPEYVDGLEVSSDLFSVLGLGVARGRTFVSDDDRPGGAPVIIINDKLWQRRYGRGSDAIGSPIIFDGKSYTVVGITPAGFALRDADVFTPLGQNTQKVMQNREAHPGIEVWARLQPGATAGSSQRRAGADWPSVGEAVSEIECRPGLHRGGASPRCGSCTVDVMAAVRRGQPGAADCVRECRQPAIGAGGFART